MPIRHYRFALVAVVLTAGPAAAQPLNPYDYTTIASSFAPTGPVTINTDTLQITGAGFTTVTGVTAAQQNGGPTLAVFDFGSVNITSGVTVSVVGSRPLALLSTGNGFMAGQILLSGADAASNTGGAGGPGGGRGGNGGTGVNIPGLPGGGPGGGGGGSGASGFSGPQPSGGGFGGAGGPAGSSGGAIYGNLLTTLQGGSGGGGGCLTVNNGSSYANGGGGGGGAMQLGAAGTMNVSGAIVANGGAGLGNGSIISVGLGGSAGGSGGGVLITGTEVTVGGAVNSFGGNGGPTNAYPGGGGGGGGRVAIMESIFNVGDTLAANVGGGNSYYSADYGQAGVRSLAPTTTSIPVGQSLTVTGNTVPGFEQFQTSNFAVDGSLTLANYHQPISALTGSGTVNLTNTVLTIGANDASSTFNGAFTGVVDFVKVGLGTWTFTGTASPYTGSYTISGGTVQGPAANFPAGILDNANLAFNDAAANSTFSGGITGAGSVTKLGTGTLTMTVRRFFTQTYAGGTIVNGGTLSVAADATLGASGSTVTVNNGSRVLYTGSDNTFRTFNLISGTLAVAAANTLTLSGAVNGGFLSGAFATNGSVTLAGVTSNNSSTVNVTGPASFANYSNNGAMTVTGLPVYAPTFNQFTNQGSGSITIAAGSQVIAADFQTYGMLTLTPNTTSAPTILTNTGSSPLYFNGGSQTFVGTSATADPTGQNIVDYIDLHGNNAIVAGGLFVNNGGVYDTVGAGTGTFVAEFGALVKGAGFFQNTVKTQNGGKFQTGNSPGSATFGNFVFGPGGVSNYIFAIDDATGLAGPSPNASGLVSGWGLIKAVQATIGASTTTGNFTWTATPSNPLTVAIDTLVNPTTVGTDVAGPMADFDPTQSYSWTAARWAGAYSGPADAATLDADTSFGTSGFANPIAGTFGWSLDSSDQTLSLVYTPTSVPEPGTLALAGLAAATWAGWRRRGGFMRSSEAPEHPVAA